MFFDLQRALCFIYSPPLSVECSLTICFLSFSFHPNIFFVLYSCISGIFFLKRNSKVFDMNQDMNKYKSYWIWYFSRLFSYLFIDNREKWAWCPLSYFYKINVVYLEKILPKLSKFRTFFLRTPSFSSHRPTNNVLSINIRWVYTEWWTEN